jgi:hypothetical protein
VTRARWRFTAYYRLHQRLQAGVEYNAAAGEVGPLVTAFLLTESPGRPGLFLGTSSDRIGSPEGTQAYFATATRQVPALRASVYASLNWSEWDDRWNVPFGVTLDAGRDVVLRYMYDGQRSHALADVYRGAVGVSLMAVWLDTPGVAFYWGR